MHVRKGDMVLVIAGNDKGKKALVKEVFREADRVIVEGVNLRWRHRKPSQQNPKGERVQRESPIHASNVMHVDPDTGKGLRRRPETKAEKKKAAKAAKTAKATRAN
jgi:large subunit ribosomal protein L24